MKQLKSTKIQKELIRKSLDESVSMILNIDESFTRKIRSKKNDELTSKPSFELDNGVYILHDTLGVKTVDGWNPKDNKGVVGILLIEDDHKIVVATEDSPDNLHWSKKCELVNQPIEVLSKDAESDFNGEMYCQKLNSPDFPAAYYCLNYNKGNRDWYLPSSGELWLIRNHLEEVQTALSIVGGQKFVITWDDDVPYYWSSTEDSATDAWDLYLYYGTLGTGCNKVSDCAKVRPVSKFGPSTLKESFTRKIRSKKNDELTTKSDTAFVPDGVYILHETLGVKTVDSWNPKNNNGVVGILLVEDEHKIVVALEDSPEVLPWSKESELVNQPVEGWEYAESDFNGEMYCRKLDSPDFPAAYYCKTYNKGNRDWYLPSIGELWMIYSHFDEIQNALSIVGGQKFVTTWDDDVPVYWSSTELSDTYTWSLYLNRSGWLDWDFKVSDSNKVRPVSKFGPSKTLKESFTRKIRSKKNNELTTKADTAFFEIPDGVYILHETLGVRTVDSWNPRNNDGVVGILLIEDDHKIVVATEDSPENLTWSEKLGLINQPVDELEDAESNFNGELYCRRLDSPDFPAAYYCKTYNKGGRNWYLPSSGELWLICNHLEEIQNALSIVGGQKFVTTWDDEAPCYWSSTEYSTTNAWLLYLYDNLLNRGYNKVCNSGKVRPVSNFTNNKNLKESFTKKISSKKNTDLVPDLNYPDGVYILHETLGAKTVEGWNPKFNNGVIGILVIEDEHQLVVALEDAPDFYLNWSEKDGLVNRPVKDIEDVKSDFNGEEYCRNLNSPDFPAAYYCLNYKKGGRSWYLPSGGELKMIRRHLEKIQTALSIVGGQEFVTQWFGGGMPCYWSSTESTDEDECAWFLDINSDVLDKDDKIEVNLNVRPVSNFRKNTLKESFTKKISSKKNTDLVSEPSFILDNGVYILHETLGVRGIEGWNPKFNKGVVGILLVEDDHKIVVALEDSSNELCWSEENKLVNQPVENSKTAKSDFNGEEHCRKLNSPDFPAAYYCLNYKKGGRDWYLPSMGELWLIYRHLEEIQTALSIVGGQKFVTTWDDEAPFYWSSTERSATRACPLNLSDGYLGIMGFKVIDSPKVRPVSKFDFSTLKESFTRKIRSKKNNELTTKADTAFVPDGVYILHETLGLKGVDGWNPRNNDGVVGILLIEDDHKIVVATEDSPKNLCWSNEYGLVNQPVDDLENADSDFNGEYYCQKLNSPDFPAAYYCKTYNKGGRSWYLPSSGELWLIYNHLKEIQNALSIVGGQKLITTWDEGTPLYWSSTEGRGTSAWYLGIRDGYLYWSNKVSDSLKVRPVSAFSV